MILSFFGISVLSFVAMYHGGPCVTETVAGMECPANSFAFADFHLNFFKGFSSAYFGNFFSIYLTLVAFLMLGFISGLFGRDSLIINRLNYRAERFFDSFTPLVESKTYYWLSLHENSPSFIMGR